MDGGGLEGRVARRLAVEAIGGLESRRGFELAMARSVEESRFRVRCRTRF